MDLLKFHFLSHEILLGVIFQRAYFMRLCLMEKKCPGIGLCGVSLLKDCSAFLVVFSKAVSNSCMYRCLASLMQVSKITGENCMKEFRAISVILLTCHATMTGKAWKQVWKSILALIWLFRNKCDPLSENPALLQILNSSYRRFYPHRSFFS